MPAVGLRTVMLHASQGRIYFGTGQPAAAEWDLPEEELFEAEWLQTAGTVQVLGTQENARLLSALYTRQQTGCGYTIQIGSANHIPALRADQSPDPSRVFHDMLSLQLPPSVGGWHTMRPADYTNYALLAALSRPPRRVTTHIRTLFRAHPAYAAFSFISTLSEKAAFMLLQLIVDPRFHVDPANPDRVGRLRSRLGTEPGGGDRIAAIYDRAENRRLGRLSEEQGRAVVVFDVWSGGYRELLEKDTLGPRDFLFRAMRQMRAKSRASALLRASHIFLRFLRDVWLDRLTPPRQYYVEAGTGKRRLSVEEADGYCPQLFVPELFFEADDEIECWHRHVGAL